MVQIASSAPPDTLNAAFPTYAHRLDTVLDVLLNNTVPGPPVTQLIISVTQPAEGCAGGGAIPTGNLVVYLLGLLGLVVRRTSLAA